LVYERGAFYAACPGGRGFLPEFGCKVRATALLYARTLGPMGSYSILIGLSLAVILSYVYNLASRATRVPSVLLLLLTGIGLRQWAEYADIDFRVPKTLLEIFGISA
jgi:hypothetical protein